MCPDIVVDAKIGACLMHVIIKLLRNLFILQEVQTESMYMDEYRSLSMKSMRERASALRRSGRGRTPPEKMAVTQ
jgi:hypothetical protein